jgi:hypothetical protein
VRLYVESTHPLSGKYRSIATSRLSSPTLFVLRARLEKWGYLDTWRKSLSLKLDNRLEFPRFGFPGVHDRSPPPPKTLHWRFAPATGEYDKIRTILIWGGIHIWLLTDRLRAEKSFDFLTDCLYDHLHNALISLWLPEASIPSFSIKSEGKLLIDETKAFVEALTENSKSPETLVSFLSSHPLCSSRVCPELVLYITKQRKLLAQIDVDSLVEAPESWTWDDSLP